MTKTISQILDEAAALIEPEGAWTQRQFARDKRGRRTDIVGPAAVCWCAEGAIYRAGGNYAAIEFVDGAEDIALSIFNDVPERTQAEVVSKLREAAAKAREAGQ